MLLRGAYDLVTALERLLTADCADFRAAPSAGVPEGSIVIGDPADVISLRAVVEPGVVFDVRARAGRHRGGSGDSERHPARGPDLRGSGTRVLGGFVRGSVFGPECRVRGEIAASVFLGYGNKAHDGFVGHSVVGHWVNLGAGTTTSNLKNTYGPVRLDVNGTRIETGRTNLGSLFGDHAKTAIGTMMPTGAWWAPAPTCSVPRPRRSTCPPSPGDRAVSVSRKTGSSPWRGAYWPGGTWPGRTHGRSRCAGPTPGAARDDVALRSGIGLARQLLRGPA